MCEQRPLSLTFLVPLQFLKKIHLHLFYTSSSRTPVWEKKNLEMLYSPEERKALYSLTRRPEWEIVG